jgi:hypothetical protein
MVAVRTRLLLLTHLLIASLAVCAASELKGGVVSGTVYSAPDNRAVAGASVAIYDQAGKPVRQTTSDEEGKFVLTDLPAGGYRLRVEKTGFEPADQVLEVDGAATVGPLEIRLDIAEVREELDVRSSSPRDLPDTASSTETVEGRLMDLAPLRGDNYQALLPLVPGIVRGADGRISFKGAQPTQSGLLVGVVDATDVSTGNFGYDLPVDAIESVDVLPNPYAAEFGRFSSGIARVETRKGDNRWRFGLNNFIPRLKWRDGTVMGFSAVTPRVTFRGPLVRERLFLAQSLRYRNIKTRIPGLPDLQNDQRLESYEAFTRIDAVLSSGHSLTGTAAVFPRKLGNVGLNTFNPIEVTPDYRQRGYAFVIAEKAVLSPQLVLDTVVSFKRYDADVKSHGQEPMRITVEGNRGDFFNQQQRRTRTLQYAQAITAERGGGLGVHLFKLGVDLLHASFDGQSDSHGVEVRRQDGSLSSLITFSPASAQRVRSTDLAVFAQDAWRVNDRLRFELGFRLDRDDLLDRINASPRAGFTAAIRQRGNDIIRGGAGLFYDRTPLNVAAFETYETRQITQWPGAGPAETVSFVNRVDGRLSNPYGFIWNLEYDHRFTDTWLLKVNHFRRRGLHELIVEPVVKDQSGELRLSSRGRSRYWETEVSLRYYRDEAYKLIWSYVRSRSLADLNAYDLFFGNFRNPLIRPNEYSLTPVDAPHRFMWRGAMTIWKDLLASPVLEIRSGFAYSLFDENQNYVGAANRGGRFPRLVTLDLSVSRKVRFLRWKPRVGMQVYNLLNTFNPRDVQNNIQSPALGVFYNTIPRSWGVILQFEP